MKRVTIIGLRLLLILAVIFFIGCGGGGGGGGGATPASSTVTFESDPSVDWVAFQDGESGSWNQKEPDSTDADSGISTYSFPVSDPAGKYGIAYHQHDPDEGHSVQVIRATVSEISAYDQIDNDNLPKPLAVSGTVTLEDPNYWQWITVGSETLYGSPAPDYEVYGVAGPNDLIAQQFEPIGMAGSQNKFLIVRDIDLSTANQTVDLNFNSGVNALPYVLTVTKDADAVMENYSPNVALRTETDTEASVNQNGAYFVDNVTSGTDMFYLPASGLVSSDLLRVSASALSPSTGLKQIEKVLAAASAGPQTLDLSQISTYTAAATVNATTVTGLDYTASTQSPPLVAYAARYMQANAAGDSDDAEWLVIMTTGWLGGATTASMPDLSSAAGYSAKWLQPTSTVETAVAAFMRTDLDLTLHAGVEEHRVIIPTADFVPSSNFNTLFSGDYQVHAMEYEGNELRAFSFDVSADGNGSANVAGFGPITYTVAAPDKTLTIDPGPGYEPSYGIISGDGEVAAFTDAVYDIPGSTDRDVVLHIAVKKSTGKSNADLAGDYILSIAGVQEVGAGSYTAAGFYTARLLITAQGDGTGTWDILSHSVAGNAGMTGPFTYSVSPDGTFTVNSGGGDDFGIISPDGSMFIMSDGDITDGDGETILGVGVKKSTGQTAPDMTGEMLSNQIALYDDSFTVDVYTSRVGLTFQSNPDTFDYSVQAHSLGFTGSGTDIDYTVSTDGTVIFPAGGSVEGIVSPDGTLLVAVDTDPTVEDEIVLAVGIKR